MEKFTGFISQNVAPIDAEKIGVYDPSGARVCQIKLGNLAFPKNIGNRLYSFGAVADVHISQDTAETDFLRALSFFQDTERVDFVCIGGDLTETNTDTEWEQYSSCVKSYSIPVYPVGGNQDASGNGLTDARFKQYTGHNTFYTFTKGNDVFIMLSQIAWADPAGNTQPFHMSGLQSLYNTLEANRNKRCFVFQHLFPWGGSGDPFNLYTSDSLFGSQGTILYSLMEHYPNAIWFHGHSHQKLEVQAQHDKSNYDFDRGCHSIHIPSLTIPVDVVNGVRVARYDESQGYIIDVYENSIIVKGRDFVKSTWIPTAIYKFDTKLQNVEAGTYVDSTGTIVV